MTQRRFQIDRFEREMTASERVKAHFYPETVLGGFTRKDGTVEFYSRVNALLGPDDVLLDYGAGRGAWTELDASPFRRSLRGFQGKVSKVIACDVDEAVLQNQASDEQFVITPGQALPLEDGSIDLVVTDWVLEHLDQPVEVFRELHRILRPGGWICARTPNKYGYVTLLTGLIHNRLHTRVLKRVQPDRKEIDVFPTVFKMNTIGDIATVCRQVGLQNHTYRFTPEPGYFFDSKFMFFAFNCLDAVLPRFMQPTLMVFLRKP
jgi:SAM-dependent methyltransferase